MLPEGVLLVAEHRGRIEGAVKFADAGPGRARGSGPPGLRQSACWQSGRLAGERGAGCS